MLANVARLDQGKTHPQVTLPVDILSDLQDAFHMFDKDQQDVISIQ